MTVKLPDPVHPQADTQLSQITNLLSGGDIPLPDAPAPEVARDGLPTVDDPFAPVNADSGEPVQVAGLGLKEMAKKIGSKIKSATGSLDKAASAATPPAPPPAPKPKPKSLQEIKQGVMERAARLPPEPDAMQQAQRMKTRADTPDPMKPPVEPGRTEWRNFRSDKLQVPDDITRLIDDVAEKNQGFKEARRGVVSHAQTATESQQYGLEDLLRRKPAEAWNAAQLTAGRDILLELSTRIDKAARHVASGAASAEDMLAFRQMLAQHAAVQETLQGAVAEAGRALNIMKAASAPAGRLRSRQVLDALDELGGEDTARKLAELVLDAGGDAARIARITRKGALARANDTLLEVWINGLLSGPKTHIVNSVSNSLVALTQIPERALAGAGRKVAQAFGAGDGVELGESGAMIYGTLAGMKDGLRSFARTMKTGEPSDIMQKIEYADRKAFTSDNLGVDPESMTGKALDLLGEYYVRMPGRLLQAEDEFFKAIGYRQELHAQAWRQASREGLTGDAFRARVAELVNDPTEEIHIAAEQAARYNTFTESLRGENWIETVGQAGQKLASLPLGRYVIPFIKTPTRIAEYTLERTPLAPTLKTFRDDFAAGGARRDLALARMGLGSTVSVLVAAEAASGRITGGGPADAKVREAMMASGWRPYSILIDGKYYSYNRLDPVGALIGAAADAADIKRYAEEGESQEHIAAAVVMGFANSMTNKTYMQGLAELLDVLGDPDNEKKLSQYLSRQASGFAPAWLNFLRQSTDDTVREPVRSDDALGMTIQTFKNRIPGLSKDVPPKLDFWGEPVVMESPPLSPVTWATAKDDPETSEIIRNRIAIDRPRAVVQVPLANGFSAAVDLNALDHSGWIYHDYRQAVGRIARRNVADLMRSNGWDAASEGPEGEKAKLIRDAFTDARREALLEIMEARPEIEQAALLELDNPKSKGTMPLPAHMR